MIARKFVFPLSRVPLRQEDGSWGWRFKLGPGESLSESDSSDQMQEIMDAFRREGRVGYVTATGELFEPEEAE